jgi:hypothetical protein
LAVTARDKNKSAPEKNLFRGKKRKGGMGKKASEQPVHLYIKQSIGK